MYVYLCDCDGPPGIYGRFKIVTPNKEGLCPRCLHVAVCKRMKADEKNSYKTMRRLNTQWLEDLLGYNKCKT